MTNTQFLSFVGSLSFVVFLPFLNRALTCEWQDFLKGHLGPVHHPYWEHRGFLTLRIVFHLVCDCHAAPVMQCFYWKLICSLRGFGLDFGSLSPWWQFWKLVRNDTSLVAEGQLAKGVCNKEKLVVRCLASFVFTCCFRLVRTACERLWQTFSFDEPLMPSCDWFCILCVVLPCCRLALISPAAVWVHILFHPPWLCVWCVRTLHLRSGRKQRQRIWNWHFSFYKR